MWVIESITGCLHADAAPGASADHFEEFLGLRVALKFATRGPMMSPVTISP
jgi:hypothetical protein